MTAGDYASVVQQLYISYFGRPADVGGLAAFERQLAAAGAPTDFASFVATVQEGDDAALDALVNGFSASAESAALYGTVGDPGAISTFVDAIYNNVLNRGADAGGLAFWTQAISSGRLSLANASMAITEAALENTTDQGRIDGAVVSNKLAVASSFTADLTTTAQINGYAGDAAAAAARAMLSSVTDSTDPVVFEATVKSTIGAIVIAAGATTTLTSGADHLAGSAVNDTYNAPVAYVSQLNADTLNSADAIDGGGGANTLNATLLGFHETPVLSNIQTVKVAFIYAGILDLLHATGVTSVLVNNSFGVGTVANIGAIATLGVSAQNADVVFANSTAKTLVLTLDTFGSEPYGPLHGYDVNLSDDMATTINLATNNSKATITTSAAITTLSVAASGSSELTFNGAALTAVTVTGSGFVGLDASLKAISSFDASANSGGVLASVGAAATSVLGGAGNDLIEFDGVAAGARVNMGAGSDSVLIHGAMADTAVIDGGAGSNDLILTLGSDLSALRTAAQFHAAFLNFQYLEVTGFDTQAETVDLSVASGFSAYFVETGTVVLENIAAGAAIYAQDIDALTLDSNATAVGAIVGGAVALTLDNQNDTADYGVTVGRLGTDAAILTLHSKGTVVSFSANTVTLDGTEVNLSKVVIDGAQSLHLTTGALAGHTLSIDASAATGALTIDASAALERADITGGSGADTLKSGTVGGVIAGGAGGDTIVLDTGSANTIVYKAAGDSVLSVDATGATPGAGIDTITGFVAGTDRIDLSGLALDGPGVVAKTAADLNALTTLATTAGFYADAGGAVHNLVEVIVAGDSYLFVDANKDHKFDAATDLVIKLAGVTAIATGDLILG